MGGTVSYVELLQEGIFITRHSRVLVIMKVVKEISEMEMSGYVIVELLRTY